MALNSLALTSETGCNHMELYTSKLILFLNGFSICVFCLQPSQAHGTTWYHPKTEPLQYSHSNLLKSNAKFSLMPVFIAFASRFFCASVSATERWCCDNRCFLSSSQCCIFPLESLLVTLPGCPICAFCKVFISSSINYSGNH